MSAESREPYRLGLALAVLLFAPLAASAAGLGRVTVLSILGEPLNAEIEIVSLLASEQESLAANLAPADVYGRMQLTPIPRPDAVRIAIERKPDSSYIVRVSSTEPIAQPLVTLLVSLSWAGGDAMRQYTFLLDSVDRRGPPSAPPERAPKRASAAAPTSEPKRAPAAAPTSEPQRAAAVALPPRVPREPDTSANVARAPSSAATATTYTVQPGDTLFKIAQSTQYDGVTVAQMIVAIYHANQDAFAAGRIDRLKSGRTLTIPPRAAAAGVTAEEARQVIAAQQLGADEGRSRAAALPPADSDDSSALDRALVESRNRIGALEQTLTDLRRLIEAQDREIAELERRRAGGATVGGTDPAQPPRKGLR